MYSIAHCLNAVILMASLYVPGLLAAAHSLDSSTRTSHVTRATFRDDFDAFSTNAWSCEYTCPVVEGGKARFRLRSGVPPDSPGSWSKARYKAQRFTSGNFTVSFSLTARPTEQPVWWGVALWDDGPNDFSEINFGYTTDQSFSDTQLYFESARRGNARSVAVDVGVDLYSEEYHTATLEYDADHVAFFFDGEKVGEITDRSFIPTDPMDLLLGPRLVTGGEPLTEGFTQSIDWVEILS
ncbi:hypothetical protein SLS62_003587 [Diatrype stigma]|uniref:GH16 domain-containing protein n=1 Tax=Diatrype stigma TaxID=117547 RepID=A0AAN9YU19_9PEZI